jgi:general secretion pathway protein I
MLVLSIALVSLFVAHSRALRTSRIATNYAQARILGESLLAKAVSGWNGKLRSEKGVSNGFAWSVEIAPETASWAKIETKNNWRLRHVRVRVGLGDGREIKLDTLKLGRSNG